MILAQVVHQWLPLPKIRSSCLYSKEACKADEEILALLKARETVNFNDSFKSTALLELLFIVVYACISIQNNRNMVGVVVPWLPGSNYRELHC